MESVFEEGEILLRMSATPEREYMQQAVGDGVSYLETPP
jgi:hypothetical protein